MLDLKRWIQISLLLLALISSFLLGIAVGSPRLIAIAFVGAGLGFWLTDIQKIFRLEGALANIASIGILILAMKDFFPEDSTGKLIAVANLLVYLQTVLMFQVKTPRLNWQVLMLSVLQLVVAAIFSLEFEAGLLLPFYFVVAGAAMTIQSIYANVIDIKRQNRFSASQIALTTTGDDSAQQNSSAPITFFEPKRRSNRALYGIFGHLSIWLVASFVFTGAMFYVVPRHARPWFGPESVEVSSTGISKAVDLDNRDLIRQSSQVVFRAQFNRMGSEEPEAIYGQPPYFRGVALSSLVIEDGKTNWVAPHDRIHSALFKELRFLPDDVTPMLQTITLSETQDPLVYGAMPFFRVQETPRELVFCHELSAFSRCKIKEQLSIAPYKYQSATVVDEAGRLSQYWPYLANTVSDRAQPMSKDQPQRQWLTQIESERYPTIAQTADRLFKRNQSQNGSRIDLLRMCENHFLNPDQFKYTLDFREIERDDNLDPVEDFMRNHRSGHCELYASALTLMLRHLDIPARLVVGFYGSEYNELTDSYTVRGRDAHAWVEAYLRPEDCTPRMNELGQAGPGGAWMRLDSTPLLSADAEGSVSGDAIDLARTVWNDYVLGLDTKPQDIQNNGETPITRLMRYLDIDGLVSGVNFGSRISFGPWLRNFLIALIILVMLGSLVRASQLLSDPQKNNTMKISRLQQMITEMTAWVAPWVMRGRAKHNNPTAFYQRLSDELAKLGLQRASSQTHREFADQVTTHFHNHPSAALIDSVVHETTERFNDVRFGESSLETETSDRIAKNLDELTQVLRDNTVGTGEG